MTKKKKVIKGDPWRCETLDEVLDIKIHPIHGQHALKPLACIPVGRHAKDKRMGTHYAFIAPNHDLRYVDTVAHWFDSFPYQYLGIQEHGMKNLTLRQLFEKTSHEWIVDRWIVLLTRSGYIKKTDEALILSVRNYATVHMRKNRRRREAHEELKAISKMFQQLDMIESATGKKSVTLRKALERSARTHRKVLENPSGRESAVDKRLRTV